MSVRGQKAKYSLRAHIVRYTPNSRLNSDIAACPERANFRSSLASGSSISSAIFVHELPLAVGGKQGLDIVSRVASFIARRSVTDFEIRDVAFCSIQQVMCDALGISLHLFGPEQALGDIGIADRFLSRAGARPHETSRRTSGDRKSSGAI